MFTAVLCVLRARASRSEVRGDTDRVYDTIQEREAIATERNTAYTHVGVRARGDVGMTSCVGLGEGLKSDVSVGSSDVEYEEVRL